MLAWPEWIPARTRRPPGGHDQEPRVLTSSSAAAIAERGDSKTEKLESPSPFDLINWPPCLLTTSATRASWSARALDMASGCESQRAVEPTMSVRQNVLAGPDRSYSSSRIPTFICRIVDPASLQAEEKGRCRRAAGREGRGLRGGGVGGHPDRGDPGRRSRLVLPRSVDLFRDRSRLRWRQCGRPAEGCGDLMIARRRARGCAGRCT
jgi:hypothetical protein